MKENLSKNEVHVWTANPKKIGEDLRLDLDHLRDLLNAEERRRMGAFYFEKDALHFLVAHALKRQVLALYTGRQARDLRFVTAPAGKPSLAEPDSDSGIEFNLTHTDGLVACAISRCTVGVDAESSSRDLSSEVAKKVLNSSELKELLALPPEKRQPRFLMHWTLKEAYLKARGIGIVADLKSFGFKIRGSRDGGDPIHFDAPPDDLSENWEFFQTVPSPEGIPPLAAAVKKLPDSPKAEFSVREYLFPRG